MNPRFRLQRKPDVPAPAKTASPERLARLNMLLYVVQTLIITGFGFALTGRLDLALKERQTSVQERLATVHAQDKMGLLLTDINKSAQNEDARMRTVLQVAMYGSDAIYPLFIMAVSRNDYSPATPIVGLRLLALRHRDEVCTLLNQVAALPTAVHELRKTAVAELTTELDCVSPETSAGLSAPVWP